jgi:nicotinamidase/pyrazinamidase
MRKHLIIVDVQNDFVEGSLGVERGLNIIPNINKLSNSGMFDTIVATQDWHPAGHCSFDIWPVHCVQNYWGSELHNDLDQSNINIIFRKGMKIDVDSYSAFFDNAGKETLLARYYVPNLDNDEEFDNEFYIVGIATDFCVKATALDCMKYFETEKVTVILDACASVTFKGEAEANTEMLKNQVSLCMAEYLIGV